MEIQNPIFHSMPMKTFRAAALGANNLGELMVKYFTERMDGPRRVSLRALSSRMGYKNPSYLSDVLSGRRKVKASFITRLPLIENLDATEMTLLNNMLFVEGRGTPELKAEKAREIESIRELWRTEIVPSREGVRPGDLILLEAITNLGTPTFSEITKYLEALFDPVSLRDRLGNLVALGELTLEGEHYRARDENRRLEFSMASYTDLPVNAAIQSGRMVAQNIFTFPMRTQKIDRVRAILTEAAEKLAVLASEEATHPTQKDVICLYLSSFWAGKRSQP